MSVPSGPSRQARSHSARNDVARHVNGVLFALPAILLVSLVTILPLGQAFYYSFTNWNGATASWVGLSNYANLFADPELSRSLLNSLLLFLSVPFGLILPFVTAYLLHKSVRNGKLYRAIIFAPTALSWVVIGIVSRQFFSGAGPLNSVLSLSGMGSIAPNWLADSTLSLGAVVFTFNAALFGLNTTIFLTGLATLDRSTIEAARIDGANEAQIIRYVILPAMRRFLQFVFIITVVTSFTGLFGMIYVMTGGGPGSATLTLDFAIWRRALSMGRFGSGVAIGIALMTLTLLAMVLIRFITGSRERDDA